MQIYWEKLIGNRNLTLGVLFLICTLSFIPHLGVFDPSLMEARNFVTSREMIQDANWLLPTMNGEPRIAKPPMPTWITAIFAKISGKTDNVFLLRLPAVLAGLILIYSIYFFIYTRSNSNQLAFICGAIAATSLLILQMARTGSWDIHCHAWMMAALACFMKVVKTDSNKTVWISLAALFMGFSVLSKGPISFYTVLLPFIIATIALKFKYFKKINAKQWIVFFTILIVVSLWWPVFVYFNKSGLGLEVIKNETTAWTNRHVRPFYFYFHFPIYIGIWAIIVLASFFWKYARAKFDLISEYKFLIIWILVSLFLLSIIPEKKERYMLPIMIPMALMSGKLFHQYINGAIKNHLSKNDKLVLLFHSSAITLFIIATCICIYIYGVKENNVSLIYWMLVCLFFVIACILIFRNKANPIQLFSLTLVTQLLIIITVLPTLPVIAYPNKSFESLSVLRKNKEIIDLKIYSLGELNLKKVYAIGQKVNIINHKDLETFPKYFPHVLLYDRPISGYLGKKYMNAHEFLNIDTINASRVSKDHLLYISIVTLKNE